VQVRLRIRFWGRGRESVAKRRERCRSGLQRFDGSWVGPKRLAKNRIQLRSTETGTSKPA